MGSANGNSGGGGEKFLSLVGGILKGLGILVAKLIRTVAVLLRAATRKTIAWFRGGKTEQQRRLRQRTVPLGIIATVSVVAGLGFGATAGGGSGETVASESAEAPSIFNQRPRVIGCEPGTDGTAIRNGPRDSNKVALTFDDGPGPETRQVMEILKKHDAGATFFVLGNAARNEPEVIADMVLEGFEVGTHSMGHEEYPDGANMAESRKVIYEASGFMPCLFRPPYGLTDSTVEANAMANGMANILWDVDTSDYAAASADEILSQIQSTTSGSILVMHDGPENRQATVDALPVTIENLKADGYELVSVTELLGQEFIPAPR